MNIRLLKLPTRESVSPKSTTSVCLNAFTVLTRAVQRKQAARVLDLQLSSTLPKDTAERFLLKAVNREQHLPQCSDVNIFTILCRENKLQAVLCILYCAVPLFIAQTIQFHESHIKNAVFRQISKIITKLSDFTNSLQFIDNPMTLV